MNICVFKICIVFIAFVVLVAGHGMLIDPPGRSTAWRFGFPTPVNYHDNELFCGGFVVQWFLNGGKCGVCGDPYGAERKNELPDGIFAKDLIVTQKYARGSVITATAQLSANHRGYFIFKICPAFTRNTEVTQECLDSNVLHIINSNDKYMYELPSALPGNFSVSIKLPEYLVCERCVLQWTYVTGNNWGKCEDGSAKIGCGIQETFRNCADIEIFDTTTNQAETTVKLTENVDLSTVASKKPSMPRSTTFETEGPTILQTTAAPHSSTMFRTAFETEKSTVNCTNKRDEVTTSSITRKTAISSSTNKPPKKRTTILTTTHETSTKNAVVTSEPNSGKKKCLAIGTFAQVEGMTAWCESMCATTDFCPSTHCQCMYIH